MVILFVFLNNSSNRMVIIRIFVSLLMVQVSTQYSISQRAINGNDGTPDEFLFIAEVQVGYPPFVTYAHECTATVVDEFWILSTAVCIESLSYIYVGSIRVKIGMFISDKDDDSIQIRKIANMFVHENFTRSSNFWINDIGLIMLKTAIENPVIARLGHSGPYTSGEVYIAGWALTLSETSKVLLYGYLLIEKSTCQSLLNQGGLTVKPVDSQICMHLTTDKVTDFTVDTGSPIVQYVNGVPEIIGLLSWTAYPKMMSAGPRISTSIAYFRTWIDDNIKRKPTLPELSLSSNSSTPLIMPE